MSLKQFISEEKERLAAESSVVGHWLKVGFGYVLGFCVACGSIGEFAGMIPQDWIPMWLKTTLAVAAVIGWYAGKRTVKQPE